MNVIQILKKLLTPAGTNIYPGDLFFASKRIGYVIRKIKSRDRFYFQIRWTGTTEHLVDEFSALEIREKIEAGDWHHKPTIIKKPLLRKIR
jgi:hypothetical protein